MPQKLNIKKGVFEKCWTFQVGCKAPKTPSYEMCAKCTMAKVNQTFPATTLCAQSALGVWDFQYDKDVLGCGKLRRVNMVMDISYILI